jgi:3-phenylpropionate/cinnamic acid dioxygenase small subunit
MLDAGSALLTGQNLLIAEAVFLDEQRWDEWLALYADDCEYWVPSWRTPDQLCGDPQAEISLIYYSNRAGLEDRVARLRSRKSPASSPMRRTTHLLANHMLLDSRPEGWMRMRSSWNCHVHDPHRNRTHVLFGHSTYEIAQREDRWLILKRKTVVQNDTLPDMVDFYCL